MQTTPLLAVEAGPIMAAGALGGGLAYANEGANQFATASPDAGALFSETVQAAVLSMVGAKIGLGAMRQTESTTGGIALGTTVNAIVLPQVGGAMGVADALLNGGDPAQAYGETVISETAGAYIGGAGDAAKHVDELESRR
jgi:hypothetical protein